MNDFANINAEGTTLRKHQLKMLEMLVFIDDLCRKNNIRYWLSGGTLLGAVRHKGFIPWDDDLDIAFFRKDFAKLHTLLQGYQGQYALQAYDTDPNYIAPYEKLRMKNTLIEENNDNDHFYRYKGIYIDLFYLEEGLPLFHYLSDKLQTLAIRMMKNTKGKKKLLPSAYIFFLRELLYPLFRVCSKCLATSKVSYPLGSFFHTQFKKDWIYPLKEMEFEGRMFYVPANYDSMLRAQYGNYMQIPPANEITTHIRSVQF